jgi:hypothetical protein
VPLSGWHVPPSVQPVRLCPESYVAVWDSLLLCGDSLCPCSDSLSGQRALLSGQPALLSGRPALLSGRPALLSRQPVPPSGQPALPSGQPAPMFGQLRPLSGQTSPLSGQPAPVRTARSPVRTARSPVRTARAPVRTARPPCPKIVSLRKTFGRSCAVEGVGTYFYYSIACTIPVALQGPACLLPLPPASACRPSPLAAASYRRLIPAGSRFPAAIFRRSDFFFFWILPIFGMF